MYEAFREYILRPATVGAGKVCRENGLLGFSDSQRPCISCMEALTSRLHEYI